MAAVDEAFTGHRVTFFVEVFDNTVSCLFNENMEMLLHSLTAGLVAAVMFIFDLIKMSSCHKFLPVQRAERQIFILTNVIDWSRTFYLLILGSSML